jgi:hypothetical protein
MSCFRTVILPVVLAVFRHETSLTEAGCKRQRGEAIEDCVEEVGSQGDTTAVGTPEFRACQGARSGVPELLEPGTSQAWSGVEGCPGSNARCLQHSPMYFGFFRFQRFVILFSVVRG